MKNYKLKLYCNLTDEKFYILLSTGVFPGNYVQHVQEDSIQKSGKLKTSSKSSSKQERTSGPDLIDFSSDIMDVFAASTTTSTSSSNSLG